MIRRAHKSPLRALGELPRIFGQHVGCVPGRVVDLPAPFGPGKAVTVPGRRSKPTWSTMVRLPQTLVSPAL
ncbi:hypothetical protein SAMN05421507_10881 [Lentzea jiangxiensis]|uniref:Uncharacterized protein n=1 Tax=Lentzea jiangxiensis TaxID=641025 RepID=A0A1H0SJD8_9PSEU|nr:hypothetical protein SAMN05421507_10881 [Lentzea jiangxiensis]